MEANKFIYDTIKVLTRDYPANCAMMENAQCVDGKDEFIYGNFSWVINNNVYYVNVNADKICLRVYQRTQNFAYEPSSEIRLINKFEGKELANIYSWLYNTLDKHNERLMKIYDLTKLPDIPLKDMIPTVSVGNKMDDLV